MNQTDDFKLIKKNYGEKMAQFCCHQGHFSKILETKSLLFKIISSKIAPTKFLYEDLEKHYNLDAFVNAITAIHIKETNQEAPEEEKVTKTPEELLKEVGYTLYRCTTEEDIQSFRHYYYRGKNTEPLEKYISGTRPQEYEGEELCTFNGDRLGRCHVFFAVKDNADQLKREDFIAPKREDEYGTSVISIQFSRGNTNTLSIKNRYNHTVFNPDATFGNNLDNIIPGLTKSFEQSYGLNINSAQNNPAELWQMLDGYVLANDEKYYKYNFERDNVCYCPNNIIIDNFEVIQLDKSQYLIIDDYIIDKKNKTIKRTPAGYRDSFIESIGEIESIEDRPDNTLVINKDIIIKYNKYNQLISYTNPQAEVIYMDFLDNNSTLEEISLPNVKEIGTSFLESNTRIKELNFPNLEKVYYGFLENNKVITKVSFPKLKLIGGNFLHNAEYLREVDLPETTRIGDGFISNNKCLTSIYLPKAEQIGDSFLRDAYVLEKVDLPNVHTIGKSALAMCKRLKSFSAPKLWSIETCGLFNAINLEKLDIPNIVAIGNDFLHFNQRIESLYLPELVRIDARFMRASKALKTMDCPKLEQVGNEFLANSTTIEEVNFPSLESIGYDFIRKGGKIKKIELPSAIVIRDCFMNEADDVEEVILPKVVHIDSPFLMNKTKGIGELKRFSAPVLKIKYYEILSEKIKKLIDEDKEKGKSI